MRDIDFIRYLIDLIDSRKARDEDTQLDAPETIEIAFDNDHSETGDEQDNFDDTETPLDRDDVFIPPLQAKLEIMKKMAGIEPKNQELLASEIDADEPFDG